MKACKLSCEVVTVPMNSQTFSGSGKAWQTLVMVLAASKMFRGGGRNLPTEGLELPTGRLKWLKNTVFMHDFAKFPPAGTQNFLRRAARCFRQGGG